MNSGLHAIEDEYNLDSALAQDLLSQLALSDSSNDDDQYSGRSESASDLHAQLHSERQNHQKQMAFAQKLLRQCKETAKRRILELETRISTLERTQSSGDQVIQAMKENLKDLSISEHAYLDALSVPENERSLRQLVIIDVYKHFKIQSSKVADCLEQIAAYQKAERNLKDDLRQTYEENSQLKKQLEARNEEFLTEIDNLRCRNKELSEEHAYVSAILDSFQLKAKHITELEGKSTSFELECDRLKKSLSMAELKVETLTAERDKATAELTDQDQANELLRLDKRYLERDNEGLHQNIKKLETELQELSEKSKKLQLQRDESYEKFEILRTEWKIQYEDRLNAELLRLQESNGKELDLIRIHQKEAYEREISGLKEHVELLICEKDKTVHKCEELRSLYDKLRNESQLCQATLERQIQELRSQLKVKSFEFERLSIAYEQSVAQHRKLSQSLERSLQENDVYKKQYYLLRTDASRIQAELTTTNDNLKEKLQTYEKLEQDLDAVITCADDDFKMEAGISAMVPSMPSRRLKHSINLAQRLLQKQKELQSLKEELDNRNKILLEKEEQLSEFKADLANVEQPYQFLVESIKQRERQLKKSQGVIAQLYQEVSGLQKENETLLKAKGKLEMDLRSLLKTTTETTKDVKPNAQAKTFAKQRKSAALPAWCQKLVQHNRINQQLKRGDIVY